MAELPEIASPKICGLVHLLEVSPVIEGIFYGAVLAYSAVHEGFGGRVSSLLLLIQEWRALLGAKVEILPRSRLRFLDGYGTLGLDFCLFLERQQTLQILDSTSTAFQLIFKAVDIPSVLFYQALKRAYFLLSLDRLLILEAEVAADDSHMLL